MNTGPESPQAQLVAYRQELAHTSANDPDNDKRTKAIKAAIAENTAAVKTEIARLKAVLKMDETQGDPAQIEALEAVLSPGDKRADADPETATKPPVAERAVRKRSPAKKAAPKKAADA